MAIKGHGLTGHGFKATLVELEVFPQLTPARVKIKNKPNNQLGKEIMKKLLSLMLVIFSLAASAQSIFQPLAPMPNGTGGFQGSINNFQNSPYNFQNSPYNFQNSPYNFQNSPLNSGTQNGIFDSNGNRTGYTTQSPSGVINIWDNNGNRLGYVPGR